MAATRLIPLHVNKGRSILKTLELRTDYAKNPEKTKKGELVTAYECDPMTVEEEFMLSKRQYQHITGRRQKSDVIAYQIRQSFKPGEIDEKEANRLGYELAMRFAKGEHAFIVATHVDKAHIHNHIVFNSTSLDGQKKFRNFYHSNRVLQKISDLICLENGLSVIEQKPYSERHDKSPYQYPKSPSVRDILCADIDEAFKKKLGDITEFIRYMEEAGYESKCGAHLAFKKKGRERFIRLDSLKEGYKEQDIYDRLSGKAYKKVRPNEEKIGLLMDIQEKLNSKGAGYARWAKTYNLKQMAKSLLFLRDHGIDSLEELNRLTAEKTEERDALLLKIKECEKRMDELSSLKTHIINYSKTRQTYIDYRKAGYSKKFLEEHREEITLHKAAKEAFDKLGKGKLPKIKDIGLEYEKVLSEKKKAYSQFKNVRDEAREFATVKKNIESLYESESYEEHIDKKKRREKNEGKGKDD